MKVLITGGAGFIGTNAAKRFLHDGWKVALLDNMSRQGARANFDDLRREGEIELTVADVRDTDSTREWVKVHRDADLVLHLAAQVAVTTSVEDPLTDSAINLGGTLNLLEGLRSVGFGGLLVYASTNKVYGRMDDLRIGEHEHCYVYQDLVGGIDEQRPLDFHSPYGCSKGAADQYVRDYARIFGLRTAVFRQSCIYGPHQYGVEDQGWVAWFTIAATTGRPITIYGDGKQVRDVLWVDDLVESFVLAHEHSDRVSGEILNIGGGPEHVLSLLELIEMLEDRLGVTITPRMEPWRQGDQRVFISDVSKAQRVLGWRPTIPVATGLNRLVRWVDAVKERF